MKHQQRKPQQTPNQLQLSIIHDEKTHEPNIIIKIGLFTEIALSFDQSRALVETLNHLHQMHADYVTHRVERARINAKQPKKTRGVASGR